MTQPGPRKNAPPVKKMADTQARYRVTDVCSAKRKTRGSIQEDSFGEGPVEGASP